MNRNVCSLFVFVKGGFLLKIKKTVTLLVDFFLIRYYDVFVKHESVLSTGLVTVRLA